MTFQYARKVASDIFVIASDTLCSVAPETEESLDYPHPSASEYRSKMSLCEKHQILIAHAGFTRQIGASPSGELAAYLSDGFGGENSADLKLVLEQWGETRRERFPRDKFLIVSPRTKPHQLWKLSMYPDCHAWESTRFFNGDERNSAVFWPDFFDADTEDHDLRESISDCRYDYRNGAQNQWRLHRRARHLVLRSGPVEVSGLRPL